jgi:hypothetical protein
VGLDLRDLRGASLGCEVGVALCGPRLVHSPGKRSGRLFSFRV